MSVIAVFGSPGSYKSVHVLEEYIVRELRKGRDVYTNLDRINPFAIASYYGMNVLDVDSHIHILGRVYDNDGTFHEDPNIIRHFWENVPLNCLIVIDEAQNYFGSRDFKEDYSKTLIPYITKHRHLGHDVIYITQDLGSVDISFRRNTHITYKMLRLEHVGRKNSSKVFAYQHCDIDRRAMATSTYTPHDYAFECYSSYESGEVTEERKTYNVILRNKGLWAIIIAVIVLLIFWFMGVFDVKSKIMGAAPAPKKTESSIVSSTSEVKDEIDPKKNTRQCIKGKYLVHGLEKYVLLDGTVVSSPGNYYTCSELGIDTRPPSSASRSILH